MSTLQTSNSWKQRFGLVKKHSSEVAIAYNNDVLPRYSHVYYIPTSRNTPSLPHPHPPHPPVHSRCCGAEHTTLPTTTMLIGGGNAQHTYCTHHNIPFHHIPSITSLPSHPFHHIPCITHIENSHSHIRHPCPPTTSCIKQHHRTRWCGCNPTTPRCTGPCVGVKSCVYI